MSADTTTARAIVAGLEARRDEREALYKEFHQHPELSLQEDWTSARIVEVLDAAGIPVTRVGRTGLVSVIENGDGAVVAMRADIDGLPMKEVSGKDYAATATSIDESTGQETPVAHSCGHDIHIMGLLGALECFHANKEAWSGTFVGVFQPAEETAAGAQYMVDNGIADVMPKPDVYLGQHVMSSLPGGHLGTRPRGILTAAKSIRVTLHGQGTHGSMPNLGVDPIVLGAAIVMRLQTIVSREIASLAPAVVTVGSFHAGSKSNIISDTAVLELNTRAYDKDVEAHVHSAIERIVYAEAEASNAPKKPDIEYYDVYPLTDNDPDKTAEVRASFDAYFGEESIDSAPLPASEDFSIIPDHLGVPYVYWTLGGFNDASEVVGNHNPAFAPDLWPTLDRGVESIVVAAGTWLFPDESGKEDTAIA